MTFPILGGNSAVAGYSIDNSLRFNGTADSCYLSRTPSSTTDRQKFTISFWLKRAKVITRENILFESRPSAGTYFAISFRNSGSADSDRILFQDNSGLVLTFAPRYRDVSAWYHIVASFDTTQATASNRAKLYVNGTQITDLGSLTTYPSQNANLNWNVNQIMSVGGSFDPTTQSPDIYLAEAHSIDGQALSPTDFGEFDTDSGIWKPIEYTGTYGTNGFYLDFENSGSLGADQSGNGNNFTPTNLASTDQTTDTPTNNFATLNPLIRSNNITFSEGNTKIVGDASANFSGSLGTISSTNGKWYCEMKVTDATNLQIGALIPTTSNIGDATADVNGGVYYHYENIYWQDNNTVIKVVNSSGTITNASVNGGSNSVSTYTTNDIIMMALDLDNGLIWFGKNGTWENSGVPASGTNGFVLPTNYANGMTFYASLDSATAEVNFGNPSFSITSGNSDGNGYGNFEYAPPTGFLALCTQNLATALSPTIDDGSQYFNNVTYAGNGSSQSITGLGFQPDWVWIKSRTNAYNHVLYDSSRGDDLVLVSNSTQAEATNTNFGTFDSDGFTLAGGGNSFNASANNYIGWCWTASGSGTTSSNTDGSITSTVQANTTAGFSIVTYTGNGTSGATVGHGLGKAPSMYVVKKRNNTANWDMYHIGNDATAPETKHIYLNSTDAVFDNVNRWNDTAPTSSVFSLGDSLGVNGSSDTFVAYCFAEIEGYSKFGSYTGNGSTDGPFVYTGFRPSFIVVKGIDGAHDWHMFDTTRDTFNVMNHRLQANTSGAEDYPSGYNMDSLSNGFKITHFSYAMNTSGERYIYLAFASNPFVSSTGIPVTAR